jgi:hypothetical protein
MTFLQICQKANTLAGLQGTVTATTGVSGYQESLIEFCREAFMDIQDLRKDWPWMRSSVSFNTVANTSEYSLATIGVTDMARWVPGMILYKNANDEYTQLGSITYDEYILRKVTTSGSSIPSIYALDPVDKHLYLNPPNDVYEIECHYYTLPVELSASADTPLLPPAFHMLIAYQGAAHMAAFMGNNNLFGILTAKADAMLGDLMRSENPGKRMNVVGIV